METKGKYCEDFVYDIFNKYDRDNSGVLDRQ